MLKLGASLYFVGKEGPSQTYQFNNFMIGEGTTQMYKFNISFRQSSKLPKGSLIYGTQI